MSSNSSFPLVFDFAFGGEPTEWLIDGTAVDAPTTEVATHQSLILGFRVSTSTLTNTLRDLKPNEGQLSVLRTDSGGYRVVDRAGGANTFTVRPPGRRRPLRYSGDYHVRRYEETLVSQSVDEWDVEIEFVPAENRTDSPSASASAAADEWEFQTRYGDLATPHVDAEFLGSGRDGVERFELLIRLGFDEAHVFEAALAQLEGTRIRSVVDGPNKATDDTGGANTVQIISPVGSEVPDSDYIVLGFESERLNDAFQAVTTQVVSLGTAVSGSGAYGVGTYNAGTYNK